MTKDSDPTHDDAPQVLTASWSDLPTLKGKRFRGDWFSLPAANLDLFDIATCVAQNSGTMDDGIYPEGLVEGFHLLALLDHLHSPLIRISEPDFSGWNYGFDHVRFVSTVTVTDRIRLAGEVLSVEPKGHRYLLTLGCAIEVAGRTKPGLVADWKVMWTRTSLENDA